jgi:hypothetical protein
MSTTVDGAGQSATPLAVVDLESATTTTLPLAVTDEKQETNTPPQEKKKGFFSFLPSKNKTDDNADAKDKEKDKPPEFPPVPFSQLFRFHSKSDLAINLVGVVCAIASGAAQVRFLETPRVCHIRLTCHICELYPHVAIDDPHVRQSNRGIC